MNVYVSSTKEAAGLGGALLAKYAWWKQSNGGSKSFEDMSATPIGLDCVAKPRLEDRKIYDSLVGIYDTFEARVVSIWASQNVAR